MYLSQRNLPANSQRKYTISLALPPSATQTGAISPRAMAASLPGELPSDLLLQAPAPSGKGENGASVLKCCGSAEGLHQECWRTFQLHIRIMTGILLLSPLLMLLPMLLFYLIYSYRLLSEITSLTMSHSSAPLH